MFSEEIALALNFLVDSTTIISSLFHDRLEMVLEPIIW
jgi:hypothetical protein